MKRASVFLMGGGWDEAAYPRTYGRFAAAASASGPARIACVVLDGEDRAMHYGWAAHAFRTVGVADTYPVYVSADKPLQRGDIESATGMFVAGGLTPAYHEAIVPSAASWLPSLVESGVPYAGISAGAMIAADHAIVGGWKVRSKDRAIVVCSEELSEARELLDVRPGLGLVPFAVDAHAAQYGSPTRLMHAINAGMVAEGWAIDEETMVEVNDGEPSVRGLGVAWRARRYGDSVRVAIVGESEHD